MAAMVNCDTVLVYPNKTKNGFPLHVVSTLINPEKENVILLHGYMGSIRDYKLILDSLTEEYNIIAVDLRGHGQSGVPDNYQDEWTISSLAQDIYMVIESMLPIGARVNIVASSLSTAIALDFTNRYPNLVEKLFLISPTQTLDLPKWSKILMQIEKMTPPSISKFLINLTTRLLPVITINPKKRRKSKILVEKVRSLQFQSHQKILRETVLSWKIDISQIDHPVLILAGEEDHLVLFEDSNKLNESLPNSSMIAIPNTGHRILSNFPEIVLLILNFWLGVPDLILNSNLHLIDENYEEMNEQKILV